VDNLKRRGAVHWKDVAAEAAKANASTTSHGQTNGLAISIVSVLLQSTEPGQCDGEKRVLFKQSNDQITIESGY
jgi:hypothetical protein